jgi:hypothetical protein
VCRAVSNLRHLTSSHPSNRSACTADRGLRGAAPAQPQNLTTPSPRAL